MDDVFTLNIQYKGKEKQVEAKFIRLGYIHQFHVSVDDMTLIFELDEERNYRVINADPSMTGKYIDPLLVEAIMRGISALHD